MDTPVPDDLDPAEISDEAGEQDTDPDPDLPDDDEPGPDDLAGALAYGVAGTCHGGPYDGVLVVVRRPKGFLLVDKPTRSCWVYDYSDGDGFTARTSEPQRLDDAGRWRAVDEGNYDLLVLDRADPLTTQEAGA